MNGPYTASERLYLDKDGKVVKAGDPDYDQRVSLLVGKNGTIPNELAAKHGLVPSDNDADELQRIAVEVEDLPKPIDGETPAAYFARLTNDEVSAIVADSNIVVPIGSTRAQIEAIMLKHFDTEPHKGDSDFEPTVIDTSLPTETVESKAVVAAPENKAVTAPEATKGESHCHHCDGSGCRFRGRAGFCHGSG